MPITFAIHPERGRLLAFAEGSVTYSEIVAHLDKEKDETGLALPELIDARRATLAIGPPEIRGIVERLRSLGHHHVLGPTAVVVSSDAAFGMIRMLEALVEDVCVVRPFRKLGDAERWLDDIGTP